MAKIIITIEDKHEGVSVEFDYRPHIVAMEELTPAQTLAMTLNVAMSEFGKQTDYSQN